MVLGAENAAVVGLILKDGMKLAAIGVSVGLVIALGLVGLVEGLLFGVQPTDPAVILGVVVMTLLTALIASYIPARRVVRVAPTEALRRGVTLPSPELLTSPRRKPGLARTPVSSRENPSIPRDSAARFTGSHVARDRVP